MAKENFWICECDLGSIQTWTKARVKTVMFNRFKELFLLNLTQNSLRYMNDWEIPHVENTITCWMGNDWWLKAKTGGYVFYEKWCLVVLYFGYVFGHHKSLVGEVARPLTLINQIASKKTTWTLFWGPEWNLSYGSLILKNVFPWFLGMCIR